jgi:hypothetical protein
MEARVGIIEPPPMPVSLGVADRRGDGYPHPYPQRREPRPPPLPPAQFGGDFINCPRFWTEILGTPSHTAEPGRLAHAVYSL